MRTIKILVAGDWHGEIRPAQEAIKHAENEGIEIIVQLGDFGIWGGYSGVCYLDDMNYLLQRTNRRVLFVGGNHENYDLIDSWEKLNPRSTNGHVYVRSNIMYIPRGCVWKWGNRRYLGLGGAVSIDKARRTPGESWWWQEAITNEQMHQAVANVAGRQIDFMFTHDCSDLTPWKNRLKPDIDSKVNRQKIDWVMSRVKPKMQFHGHMHEYYDWSLSHGVPFDHKDDDPVTKIYGLGMESERNSMGILDTESYEFTTIPWNAPRNNKLTDAPELVV